MFHRKFKQNKVKGNRIENNKNEQRFNFEFDVKRCENTQNV